MNMAIVFHSSDVFKLLILPTVKKISFRIILGVFFIYFSYMMLRLSMPQLHKEKNKHQSSEHTKKKRLSSKNLIKKSKHLLLNQYYHTRAKSK